MKSWQIKIICNKKVIQHYIKLNYKLVIELNCKMITNTAIKTLATGYSYNKTFFMFHKQSIGKYLIKGHHLVRLISEYRQFVASYLGTLLGGIQMSVNGLLFVFQRKSRRH